LPLGRRLFLDRSLLLTWCSSLRKAPFLDRRRFGVSLSKRGHRRGERNKSDQESKSFQQGFSRMASGAAKHKA
jgi:hypothetical protein